jgi:hypothetical protein
MVAQSRLNSKGRLKRAWADAATISCLNANCNYNRFSIVDYVTGRRCDS